MRRKGEAAPSPCLCSWVLFSPSCCLRGLSDIFFEASQPPSTSRVGLGGSPELCSSLSLQILLNYLPLERASWTSILAKQR